MLVLSFATPLGAQELEFADSDPDWDRIEIELPNTTEAFGKVVVAQLTVNGIPDAAVLCGSQAVVLADPGRRVEYAVLPEMNVSDVAVLAHGAGSCDALLLAGSGGVTIWDCTDSPPTSSWTLTGSWSDPRSVQACPISADWQAVVVWDDDGSVHPLRVKRETSGAFVQYDMGNWNTSANAKSIVLANVVGTSSPEVTVKRSDGVGIHSLTGLPLYFYPGPEALALVACGTTVHGRTQLARFQSVESPSTYSLTCFDDGVWTPPVTFVVENDATVASVSGYSDASRNYLALGLDDGNVRILYTAVDPATPNAFDYSTLIIPGARCSSLPVLADLNLSPCGAKPELLTFNDTSPAAWVRRGLEGETDPSIFLDSLTVTDGYGILELETTPSSGTKVYVATYPWVDQDAAWGPRYSSWEPGTIPPQPSLALPSNVWAVVFEVVLLTDQASSLTPLGAAYFVLKPPLDSIEIPDFECLWSTVYYGPETPRGVVPIPAQPKPGCTNCGGGGG